MSRTTKATSTVPKKIVKKVVKEPPKKVQKKVIEKVVEESDSSEESENGKEIVPSPEMLSKVAKESKYVNDDLHCAEKILDLEGRNKFIFCQGVLYIFDERIGTFADQRVEANTTLFYYLIKNAKYLSIITNPGSSKKWKVDNYASNATRQNKIPQYIKTLSLDNDWIDRTADSSLGYLLFTNGIYNMKTGKFSKGFNPDIVFHVRVPHAFPEYNEGDMEYALSKSFDVMFDDPNQMLTSLAVALAGDRQKKFYFCPGKTNAGKSLLIEMMKKAFGLYVDDFNAEVLASVKGNNRQEESRRNGWALLIRWSRILCSNEVDMDSDLSGPQIKKFSAVRDGIIGRDLYKSNISFKPHFTCFCMLNDIPMISPLDEAVEKRLVYIEFPHQFKEMKEEEKGHFRKADPNIDEVINSKRFINGFIWLFLKAYKAYLKEGEPEYDEKLKKAWLSGQKQNKQTKKIVSEYYTVDVKNDKPTVTVAEMKKFKESHKKEFGNMSIKNYKDQLIAMGLTEYSDGTTRYWKGITKKVNDNIFDDID